jgi:dTMP kinase
MPDFAKSLHRARRRNERNARAGNDEGRFEQEAEDFYRRVYEKYREIALRDTGRVAVIEGDDGIEDVHHQILRIVEDRLR